MNLLLRTMRTGNFLHINDIVEMSPIPNDKYRSSYLNQEIGRNRYFKIIDEPTIN